MGTAGPDGPDQIRSNTYDADNRLTQVTAGYGTALAATAQAVTYSANGNVLTAADVRRRTRTR